MNEIKVRLALDSGAFVSGFGAANGRLGEFESHSQRAADAAERLTSAVSRVGHYAAGIAGVAQLTQAAAGVVHLADEYANLNGRLALVTGSEQARARVQQQLFQVAQETRTGLSGTAGLYVKLAQSTDSLGISEQRLIAITRTIGQSMALSGGDAESMQAALMQLGQGLASGTLRGEELNSVIEQTPALAAAIAQGMGRTVGELRELGKEGKITAAAIVQALEASAKSVDADFRKLPLTVGQAVTQLNNSLLQTVGVFDQANGLSRGLAEGVSFLAQNMGVLVAAGVSVAAVIGARVAQSLAASTAAVMADRAARIAALQATVAQTEAVAIHTGFVLADARANLAHATGLGASVVAQNAVIAATQRHTAALAAQSAAQGALAGATSIAGRALGLLGGPIGLVTTLLGLGATAWAAWSSSSKTAEVQATVAVAQSTTEILADLEKQIAKLRERNRLAQVAPSVAQGGGPAVERLAELQTRIDDLNARRGDAASMNEIARQAVLQATMRDYGLLYGQIQALNAEQARTKEIGQQPARAAWLEKYASDAERLQAELKKVAADFGGVIPPDLEARIREKFTKPSKDGVNLAKQYSGLVTDLLDKQSGLAADYDEKIAILNKGYAATDRGTIATDRYAAAVRTLVAQQPFAVKAAKDAAAAEKDSADKREAATKAAEQSAAQVAQRVLALQDEEQALLLQSNMAITLAAALEEVAIARLQEARAAAVSAGNTETVAAIDREIAARRELARLTDRKDERTTATANGREADQRLQTYLGKDIGTDLAAGFDQASQSVGAFAQAFGKLIDQQLAYAQARKDAGQDGTKLAAVEQRNMRAQLNSYGSLAGAAKGFFKEGTSGYRTLAAVEKAFRAMEIASAVANAAEQLGLIGAVTTAKVASEATQAGAVAAGQGTQTAAVAAGEAARNTAKIPGVFMAFMSSLGPWGMAAAAAAIAAVLGSQSGAFDTGSFTSQANLNTGTGTVLGDSSAQSESITNAVERLKDVDTMTMRYSAQMLAALQSIEANISGVTTLLIRSGGIDAATSGIEVGAVKTSGMGAIVDKAFGISVVNDLLKTIPMIGNALSNLATRDFQKLFGSSQSIVGQGIAASAQTIGQIVAGGFQASYYADVEKKDKFLGMTTNTSRSTQYVAADAELQRQFGLIVAGFSDAVQSAAVPLGESLASVQARLSGFVVDLGHIDLAGLNGTQINEKLTAVFGAMGDKIARAALPGLDAFQKIGEGYLETVARVASGVEGARSALRGLGVAVADFQSLTNKQADDIGAELVRQSLVAAETTSRVVAQTVTTGGFLGMKYVTMLRYYTETTVSGIGEVMQGLQGSAEELVSAYRGLVDARTSLRLMGMNGDAVGYDLLGGSGGLEGLTDGLAAFEALVLTDSERLSVATARLGEQFGRLGLQLPATVADYAALVRGIDTSTAAGRELLGQVLGLADAYSQLNDSQKAIVDERAGLEEQLLQAMGDTAAIRANELAKLDGSNRALQERIWALQDEKAASEALASAGQGVVAYINELRGVSASGAALSRLRATYNADLTAAQAGDKDASSRVVASARALVEAVKANATDPIELARETARVSAQLQALPAAAAYTAAQAADAAKSAQVAAAAAADVPAMPAAAMATEVPAAAVPVAPVVAIAAAAQAAAQQANADALRDELRALRAEVEGQRAELRDRLAAVINNTGRAARTLENVTPDGGDAFAVRVAST